MLKIPVNRQEFSRSIRQALSAARFDAYRLPRDADELDTISRYLWNTAVCEAFYPVLQAFEVTLRNAVHDSMTLAKSTDLWFDVPSLLYEEEGMQVDAIVAKLTRKGVPVTADKIVSELSFGFWTALFSRDYDVRVVRVIINSAFPHLPRNMRTRATLAQRFDAIRSLRNRISHHEPIWSGQQIPGMYADIINAIAWINPVQSELVARTNRVLACYRQGWQSYRPQLEEDYPLSIDDTP